MPVHCTTNHGYPLRCHFNMPGCIRWGSPPTRAASGAMIWGRNRGTEARAARASLREVVVNACCGPLVDDDRATVDDLLDREGAQVFRERCIVDSSSPARRSSESPNPHLLFCLTVLAYNHRIHIIFCLTVLAYNQRCRIPRFRTR